jgi:Mg2+ and Co2+ transporter CorA|tara:strand:+ start:622 stop:1053 length:432 start_codon:yes stop_codon:yes gene_type:complete
MNINNPYIYSFSHNYIHIDSAYFGPLASPFKRVVKPTLTEIVDNGKQMMSVAVERVITKHEKELKVINNKIKLESKSELASIARTGNCRDQMHSLMMAAIGNDAMLNNNHQRYLDSLSKGQQQYTDLLAPKMLGLQTFNMGLC